MKRVLVIGANGQIARVATRLFLDRGDVELTLFLRRARRLGELTQRPDVRVVEGDATDVEALKAAMPGHDAVYANLSGAMAKQAKAIVEAMRSCGVERLIFISSMGIYDEVPGQSAGSVLDPYRDSASVIEASGLDYTILRPAWLDDQDVVAYGTTQKGEQFRSPGATVSRRSVADLVVRLCVTPGLHSNESLGVHRA
jgi:uncharacterized protein YbjT (DUF2867 family)